MSATFLTAAESQYNAPTASSSSGEAITPHDTNELTHVTRGIYVGAAGDVVVVLFNDSTAVTFKNAAAGSVLPVRAKIVKSTGTTAMNLIALY